jgi:hypothetical protein
VSERLRKKAKNHCREKDGRPLEKDDRISARVALDGTVTLRIRDCQKSDAGRYRVIASNPSGTVDSECAVGVVPVSEKPSSPKFVIPLKSTNAGLGAKAEFNVKVRGVPTPTLRWQVMLKDV